MANLSNTLGDFLQEARILIGNSQSLDRITGALGEFGYTPDRLAEGQILLQQAEALTLAQRNEYGEQYEATQATQQAWDTADEAYQKTLRVARLVFAEDVHALASLKLTGPRQRSLAGWLDQAGFFYGNLMGNPAQMAALGRFGYSREKLAREKALVDAVIAKAQAQAKETGEAQQSTVARDEALKALDKWVGELRTVLKVALHGDIEALETVGITVSQAGRKKKAAGASAAK
jgi:hypothetical protein